MRASLAFVFKNFKLILKLCVSVSKLTLLKLK